MPDNEADAKTRKTVRLFNEAEEDRLDEWRPGTGRVHMTSGKKIAANRLNAEKSTGPKTSRGKSRARGNAWRHGCAVDITQHSTVSAHIERMAKAICGAHASPALYEQAVIIAECQMVLLYLRAARVAVIQRRKPDKPYPRCHFPINELHRAREAAHGGDSRPVRRLIREAGLALRAAHVKKRAKESHRTDREESSPPLACSLDASTQRSNEDQAARQVRDEVDAFQDALPELESLERYERRALSRRKRAIRMFEAISTFARFLEAPGAYGHLTRPHTAKLAPR